MNAKTRRTNNMLVAVDEFLDDHAITPPIAKATAEIAILKGSITELATLAANQDAGRAEWRGASDDRVRLKAALSDKLSEISAIAKVLDPVLYPAASGVKAVRILDSIMRPRLKATPALLEVWKAVVRIEPPPKKKSTEPQAVAAKATAATRATALNGHEPEQQLAGVEPRANCASA